MYVQYKDKNEQVYSLDLYELSFSALLLMFCWTIPKKMYLTKGIYSHSNKRGKMNAFKLSFITSMAVLAPKIIKIKDTEVLFKTNRVIATMLVIIVFVLMIILVFLNRDRIRRKMLKCIKIVETEKINVKFRPNGKFEWAILIMLAYITLRIIPSIIDLLTAPTLLDIVLAIALIFVIIEMPWIGFLCCDPIYNGEKLERIIP